MNKFWQLTGQLTFAQHLAVAASDQVVYLSAHWVDAPEVLVSPPLVSLQVLLLLRSVVSENLKGAFRFDGKTLFAHMAPDHMWVVYWISGTGDEGPSQSNLGAAVWVSGASCHAYCASICHTEFYP